MPGCRSSVAVSPFPLAVAVSVHRCRMQKIDVDPISTEERLRQLFAVYGYNGKNFLT